MEARSKLWWLLFIASLIALFLITGIGSGLQRDGYGRSPDSLSRLEEKKLIMYHRTEKKPGGYCIRKYLSYHSSAMESDWVNNILTYENDVCSNLYYKWYYETEFWLKSTQECLTKHEIPDKIRNHKLFERVFSHMRYEVTCFNEDDTPDKKFDIKQFIEPLAGFLRHPTNLCKRYNKKHLQVGYESPEGRQSRDFFLLGPLMHFSQSEISRVRILDYGASTWSEGKGGASQKWFYDRYVLERQLKLDRYVGFEAEQRAPEDIFGQIPNEIIINYQYFNIGISKDKGKNTYGLNFIEDNKPGDDLYVVMKMDIDAAEIENEIMRRLVVDTKAGKLFVDEVFFEHHTHIAEMMPAGWQENEVEGFLHDSYTMLLELRRMGTRAHAWP